MPASSRAARRSSAVWKRQIANLPSESSPIQKDEHQQIDRSQGKLTLAELCDRYLKTVQHQKPKTVERKTFIVRRIKTDWPTGKLTQVGKIKPSDVDLWLSRYRFGSASRNLHISCVKELFNSAVRDRIITRLASRASALGEARKTNSVDSNL